MESLLIKGSKRSNIKGFKSKFKNEITAYSLIAYPLLHWVVFFVFALAFAFYISFTSWDIVGKPFFVGIQNYKEILFKDDVFRKALANTVMWTVGTTAGPVIIGLSIAVLLHNIAQGKVFFRTLLYWPALVSAVAVTTIQKAIFGSSPYSLANKLVFLLGIAPIAWFDNPDIALFSLMLWPVILGFPQSMLFFIAGLKQIPVTYYEAAVVDGANKWWVLLKITLPLLKPIMFLNVMIGVINGFRVIAPMQLITTGGPANATTSIAYRVYLEGFQYLKMGYASAMSFILLAIILAVTFVQRKIQKEHFTFE